MKINYYVYDPSGNITVLAEGGGLSGSERLICARRLMDEAPEAEQVGFILPAESRSARGRLQMAGGEFCGNAAMSLGVHLARVGAPAVAGEVSCASAALPDVPAGTQDSAPAAEFSAPAVGLARSYEITLDVSGAEGAVCVGVDINADGGITGNVAMPLPDVVDEAEFPLAGASAMPLSGANMQGASAASLSGADIQGTLSATPPVVRLPVVRLPGMTHIIVPDADAVFGGFADEDIERMFIKWTSRLNSPAFGLLLLGDTVQNISESCRGGDKGVSVRQDAGAKKGGVSLKPLLYVPEAETLVWENACGTGSAAVAAWVAMRNGESADISLDQPGGNMRARAEVSDGKITGLFISGRVAFVRGGQIEI